jgi:hypothetical protein
MLTSSITMPTSTTVTINLVNNTTSPSLTVHITGRTLSPPNPNALFLLGSDGTSAYYPVSPSKTLTPLSADCSITLRPPGSVRSVTIPRLAGARIWYSKSGPLTFYVNPGPALVEPSVFNPTDPNHGLDWGFCEFTFNEAQLFVNVSYVDFMSIPVSLALDTVDGRRTVVPGMPPDALATICRELEAQTGRDGAGWNQLVVLRPDGTGPLRALSPNSGNIVFQGLFDGYFEKRVDAVWRKYAAEPLRVQTQAQWGEVSGRTSADCTQLVFGGDIGSFSRPSTADIFSCSTGPFASTPEFSNGRGAVVARISAALNRSTLLSNPSQPEGETVGAYYREPVTNHYSRICHEVSIGGRGYAFPYDDVGPSGGVDQSGCLFDGAPKLLTIGVGGGILH